MNSPSAMSHDLIRVTQAQTVRATRYTWHSATSQRRPGRWVANWFRRHRPNTSRRSLQPVPVIDVPVTPGHGGEVRRIKVEPHVQIDTAVAWDELTAP